MSVPPGGDHLAVTNGRRAFTIVEMIVVIAIIALVLVIGVPAFNNMAVQQRMSKARQLLNGTMTRARVLSVNGQRVAVRVCPAQWYLADESLARVSTGRQVVSTFAFNALPGGDPTDVESAIARDWFEPLADGPMHVLPPDTWVAPSAALVNDADGDAWLEGEIGEFRIDADEHVIFLDADDFLIVFSDGELRTRVTEDERCLKAYIPDLEAEAAGDLTSWNAITGKFGTPFRRSNATGFVIYPREPFAALGASADPDARRDVLSRLGKIYYVNRYTGILVSGEGGAGEE